MAVLLSIIVPVYNVKPYLDRCVNSLLRQDLDKEEYEIILVDDGSTDGGREFCDMIAARERNVKVFHQTNQGLSCARNTGMRMASGKYLQFVDSDDYLTENALGRLVRHMEEWNLEILRFGYQRLKEGEFLSVALPECYEKQSVVEIMDGPSFMVNRLWFTCYACQFMIQKQLLEENYLLFKPGILYEDIEWTPRLMRVARRVSSIDWVVYNYVMREGSITGKSEQTKLMNLLSRIDDLKAEASCFNDMRWHQGMISHIVVGIVTSVALHYYSDRSLFLNSLKAKGIYPLTTFLAKTKVKRKIWLINLSPRFACFIIHAINH